MIDYNEELNVLCKKAKQASFRLACASTEEKNTFLKELAENILANCNLIIQENAKDIKQAKEDELSSALIDRLLLNEDRIKGIVQSLYDLIALDDPVSKVDSSITLENALVISKVRVPIGVIGFIYESRPNVTVDAASLCLKSGNAVILRGGKEAYYSNHCFIDIINQTSKNNPIFESAISLIPWTDRKALDFFLKKKEYIDLVIPRGGEGLINKVSEISSIPVIKHYKGVCNIYVDRNFDETMALDIILNAKCQRPGVCNAVENVFIHQDIAKSFLPTLIKQLRDNDVEVRLCERGIAIDNTVKLATMEDWSTEYLDLILSIKVVDDIKEAIENIRFYGSSHSDAIISSDKEAQNSFKMAVDSAAVYVNCSTRFTDGSMFGMGAEIGISTDRLHARGPMGLVELTTYKYVVEGEGQIR